MHKNWGNPKTLNILLRRTAVRCNKKTANFLAIIFIYIKDFLEKFDVLQLKSSFNMKFIHTKTLLSVNYESDVFYCIDENDHLLLYPSKH